MAYFKKTHLDIDYTKLLEGDYTQREGSCITHQKVELTDIHKKYGFADTYQYDNTKIHQLWWTKDDIDYDDLGAKLGMEVVTVSSIKQPAGCTIPIHRDTFFQINKRYPDDTRLKVRANIYLEDWKVGHFLQYQRQEDKIWHNSTHWKQGDTLIWDSEILHLGANAGMKPKYTMQVSGFKIDD